MECSPERIRLPPIKEDGKIGPKIEPVRNYDNIRLMKSNYPCIITYTALIVHKINHHTLSRYYISMQSEVQEDIDVED